MDPILSHLVYRYPDLEPCLPDIQGGFEMLAGCYRRGGKVLICGNGGSAADSEHIVGELMKGYRLQRPLPIRERQALLEAFPDDGAYLADHLQGALPALSLLSQVSLLTAFSNDVAADMVFAQQVYGYGRSGDVLVSISTSGNSANILHAVQVARVRGLQTLGFSGPKGGKLQSLCDLTICAPGNQTFEIQERHQAVYHAVCAMLEEAFFQS